ncbi:MAG TPA: lysophospholipase [Cyanothece sp. UBA12306]|nr:lysophospholipase [Cyanothece sp. UBA12306]
MIDSPDFILLTQHGWTDTNQGIIQLAKALGTAKTQIIAPNFGWLKTWSKVEDIREIIEQQATEIITNYPDIPWRIICYSLGGLMWLEFVHSHPELWTKINSIVFIGCPVNGTASFGILDPENLEIAAYLLKSRQDMAEKIAHAIPSLVIAGDLGNGTDGTIRIKETQIPSAKSVCLPGFSHANLKNEPQVIDAIEQFWYIIPLPISQEKDLTTQLIERLSSIPGMTPTQNNDFERSQIYLMFQDGKTIRIWKNPLNVLFVFLADREKKCLYSGCVGWIHAQELQESLETIHQDYYELVIHGLD